MAARTSWCLARWWTASQRVSPAQGMCDRWSLLDAMYRMYGHSLLYNLCVLSSECEVSEDSSGEAELEAEPETSDPEDIRDLHPGALLYKASKARNLPVMAEALAHGADVNSANDEDEGKTPLIQAVIGVSRSAERNHTEISITKYSEYD